MAEIRTITLRSAIVGEELKVDVYVPPGFDPAVRYPVMFTDVGPVHFRMLGLPGKLDEWIETGVIQPCLAVHLPDPDSIADWDPGAPGVATFSEVVRREVVPAVEAAYLCGARMALAASSGAVYMLEVGLRCPGLFARMALQSPGWLLRGEEGLVSTLPEALRVVEEQPAGPLPAMWFGWGDSAADEWEVRSRPNGEVMMAALRARGAEVMFDIVPGGHDRQMMEGTLSPAIRFLVGVKQ